MLFFRFVVRAKVFQLFGFFTVAIMAGSILTTKESTSFEVAAVVGLIVGCVVTSYCVWYYSGRYLGELSLLLPQRRVARFSVLDFWGNRQDNDIDITRIDPPFRHRSIGQVKALTAQALMPLSVLDDKEYYISVPYGHLIQKQTLQDILYGRHLELLDREQALEAEEDAADEAAEGTAAPAAAGASDTAAGTVHSSEGVPESEYHIHQSTSHPSPAHDDGASQGFAHAEGQTTAPMSRASDQEQAAAGSRASGSEDSSETRGTACASRDDAPPRQDSSL
ncbi:MAG: hypothetical protein WDW36_005818 [Sanguina aurantia]